METSKTEPSAAPAAAPRERILWRRVAVCAAILAAAFGAVAAAIKLKPEAPTKPTAARKAGVQVVEARAEALNPVVEGYGRARPVRRVTIAAEVGGRVVRVAPGLDDGQPLAAGCLAVEIEAVDYEARVAGAAAQRDSAQASVDQLKVQTETLRRRLAVQQRILAVEQADLERVSRLEGTGVAMERELDAARRAVLRAEDTVADMAGRIAAAAPQLAAAEARVRETEAALTTAEANLKRTRIVAPFSGVVAAVTVEADQQVAPNQRLFELWDVSKVEIPVALPLEQAGLLAPDLCGVDGPEGLRAVRVTLDAGGLQRVWQGTLRRFEPVDGDTQTVKAVVEVANPGVTPGDASARRGAPLLPDVFCRVEIEAPPTPVALVIPRQALQERDRVYVVRDGRLAIVPIQVGRAIGRWVVVESGLAAGDSVIVSPLDRAVEGTPVEPVAAPGTEAK